MQAERCDQHYLTAQFAAYYTSRIVVLFGLRNTMLVFLCMILVVPALTSSELHQQSRRSFRRNSNGTAATRPSLKIAHGEDAAKGEFPFVGLLLQQTSFTWDSYYQSMCGGSILSSRVVLTAAHCVVKSTLLEDPSVDEPVDELFHPRNLQFHAGETNLFADEDTEQVLGVQGIIVHEGYDSGRIVNDIAMLILSEEIEMGSAVQPIALPTNSDTALLDQGAPVTVVGWGTTEEGETTAYLQKLEYSFASMSKCRETYGSGNIGDGMVCTGEHPMTQEHSGTGDSGGPLFTKKNGEWVQLALVSWGPEEQTPVTYDVNTNVLYYLDWITEHMDEAFTDYVMSVTATDTVNEIFLGSLRNYLYKTIIVTPSDSSKYTQITILSGTMKDYDFLIIYDGIDVVSDTMLAMLSGEITDKTYTATTTKGLTLGILTGKYGESDGFTFQFQQVSDPGTSDHLECSEGYTPCEDKFYCLHDDLFCDAESAGDCYDAKDENNCGDKDDKNEDGKSSAETCEYKIILSTLILFLTLIVLE